MNDEAGPALKRELIGALETRLHKLQNSTNMAAKCHETTERDSDQMTNGPQLTCRKREFPDLYVHAFSQAGLRLTWPTYTWVHIAVLQGRLSNLSCQVL